MMLVPGCRVQAPLKSGSGSVRSAGPLPIVSPISAGVRAPAARPNFTQDRSQIEAGAGVVFDPPFLSPASGCEQTETRT